VRKEHSNDPSRAFDLPGHFASLLDGFGGGEEQAVPE
jgi:hypothetical protein